MFLVSLASVFIPHLRNFLASYRDEVKLRDTRVAATRFVS